MERLFRGRAISDGRWVYGYYMYYKLGDRHIIRGGDGLEWSCDVIGETVSQSTGLKDKNGVEIYEGDLLGRYGYKPGSDDKIFNPVFIVQRCNNSAGFSLYGIDDRRLKMRIGMFPVDISGQSVGGNIYENNDLLIKQDINND